MAQRPNAVGLFLCEQVIVEEGTGNVTLVNCFTYRKVRQFPSERSSFVVFFLLTDGFGPVPVQVVIQRLDTLDEIYKYSRVLQFTSPLQEARCTLRVQGLSFPVPGSYEVTLFAGGDPIASRKVRIFSEGASP